MPVELDANGSNSKFLESDSIYGDRAGEKVVVKKLRNADDILSDIGSKNLYVLLMNLLLSLCWVFAGMNVMCSAFYIDNIDETDKSNKSWNSSNPEIVKKQEEEQTLADHATSLFMFGSMVGASTLTYAADKIGRKPILLCSMVCLALTGLTPLTFHTHNFIAIGRLMQGFFTPGLLLVSWVLAYECVPIPLRGYTTLIFGVFWVVGYCAVAPIAYFVPDWNLLTIACTGPAGIFALIFLCILPESIHFLVLKKREVKVREWVDKMRQYKTKKTILYADDVMFEEFFCTKETNLATEKTFKAKFTFLDELKANKIFILYLIILMFLWTCDTFVYFGLSLYTTKLAGNRYWNYTLSGLIELPAYLLAPSALEKFGRKPVVAITHFIAGVALSGLIFIPKGMLWLSTSFWLTGKFAISCSFMSILVYSNEIFPTTTRSACVGLCTVIARVGGVLAPYVRILASIVPQLPMLFFGALSIVAGVLTLFLPETHKKPLPTNVNDVKTDKAPN